MNRSIVGFVVMAASPALATITPIANPFTGQYSETWEGFGGGPLGNGASILGGNGTASNDQSAFYIYTPGGFGLGNGGPAQVSDGNQGLGINTGSSTTTYTFNTPVKDVGAFWAVAHYGGGGTSNVNFYDANNNNIGSDSVFWDRADGVLEWHGWNSDIPVASMTFDGFFPVTDGLQVNLVPAPGAGALVGIGGLLAARRRRA